MKTLVASGKRKTAVARATIKQGTGKVMINKTAIENFQPELARLKIQEPIILAGDAAKKVNITIKANGGGIIAQANAARTAVSRAMVEFTKNKTLKQTYQDYDRHLLVADVRRKETCKPNDSKARAKRTKSYR